MSVVTREKLVELYRILTAAIERGHPSLQTMFYFGCVSNPFDFGRLESPPTEDGYVPEWAEPLDRRTR